MTHQLAEATTKQKPTKPNAFKSYSSLENHTVTKFVEHIRSRGYDAKEIEWQATEKIHGCNFSVAYDGTTIRYGRRSGWLGIDEKFMGYQILIPTLNDSVKCVWELMKEEKPQLTSIHLYGELFGGKYLHPQVKHPQGISCIQTDIQYCPDLRYHVFDILCDYQYFLNCDELSRICETAQVAYAKPIARGTMDELLKFPVENQITRIPETLGLPPIAKNYWEGIVIRPIQSLYCGNGARVLIKIKTQRFLEVSRVPKVVRNAVEAASKSITQATIEGVQRYVTRPRLVTALSKIDVSTIPQLSAELLPMFVQDVMTSFRTDHIEYSTLPPDQETALTKLITRLCGKMIFTNRDAILNKTFSIDERVGEEKEEDIVDGIEANLATIKINQTIATISNSTETATSRPTETATDHNTPVTT